MLEYGEPDRVPIVIGVSKATGIQMRAYQRLKELIGVTAEDRYIYDWPVLGVAALDEQTWQRLRSDARGVLDRHPAEVYARNQSREAGTPFIDAWGIGQIEVEPRVWFPGVHPLSDAKSHEDVEQYPHWPDPTDLSRIAGVWEEAERLRREGEYAVLATPWLLFPFERAIALQPMDNFLLNLAGNREFAEALLRRNLDMCKFLMAPFLKELGENVDIIKIGDDLGTQESLLISPAMYREVLKPIHAEYIAFIKERTHAKVLFHSDGDVFPLIDDLIEIGVDILHPIQTSAGQMADLVKLKQRFGGQIIFCGGIDTHRLLPSGTPDQVREEVKRVIEILAPGGVYMLAAVHTIMNDVPAENILAMVDAAQEFGHYPID